MKKELKTELTKEKIILAAIDEFGRNGYYGSSLNSICDTGIAKDSFIIILQIKTRYILLVFSDVFTSSQNT